MSWTSMYDLTLVHKAAEMKVDEKNASSTSLPLPDGGKSAYAGDVAQQVSEPTLVTLV